VTEPHTPVEVGQVRCGLLESTFVVTAVEGDMVSVVDELGRTHTGQRLSEVEAWPLAASLCLELANHTRNDRFWLGTPRARGWATVDMGPRQTVIPAVPDSTGVKIWELAQHTWPLVEPATRSLSDAELVALSTLAAGGEHEAAARLREELVRRGVL
jgi:hypothetical protein